MHSLKAIEKVKILDLKLKVKSIKKTISKDKETLFSCDIYLGTKKIARYSQNETTDTDEIDDFSKSAVIDVEQKFAAIPPYYCPVLKKDTTVDLCEWAFAACCYADVEAQAKRERKRTALNDKNEIIIYTTPKDKNYQTIYDFMKKENQTPMIDLDEQEMIDTYLINFGYSF